MIKCHACGRDYADTATFCPFCGAKRTPTQTRQPAAGGASSPSSQEDMIEADQKTVALDISKLDLPSEEEMLGRPSSGPRPGAPQRPTPSAPSAPTAPTAPAARPSAPPSPSRKSSAKRSGTILGMPGMGSALKDEVAARSGGGGAAAKAGLTPSGGSPATPRPPAGSDAGEAEPTAAIDPAALGLIDEAPKPQAPASDEPEPTAAFDPAAMGLVDAEEEPEPTAAIDPAAMGLVDPPAARQPQQPQPGPAQQFQEDLEPTAAIDPSALGIGGPAQQQQPAPQAQMPPQRPAPQAPAPQQQPPGGVQIPQVVPPKKQGGGGGKVAIIAIVAVLLIAGVVVAVLMLGGGGGKPLEGPAAEAATHNIPKDVDGVAGLDLEKLRQSPYVEDGMIEEMARDFRPVRQLVKDGVIDLASVKAVTLGLKNTGEREPDAVIAINGSFDTGKIEPLFKEKLARKDDQVHDLSGTKWYGKPDRMMGTVSDDSLIFAQNQSLAEGVTATRGGGESFKANEKLAQVVAHIDGSAPLWGAAVVTEQLLREGGGRMMGPMAGMVKPGDVVAGSLDVSGDVVIRVAVWMAEESRAEQVEKQAKASLDQVDMVLGMLDLPEDQVDAIKEVVGGIDISRSGQILTVGIKVSQSLVEKYKSLAEGMMF